MATKPKGTRPVGMIKVAGTKSTPKKPKGKKA